MQSSLKDVKRNKNTLSQLWCMNSFVQSNRKDSEGLHACPHRQLCLGNRFEGTEEDKESQSI
jgi:hypothetical protein